MYFAEKIIARLYIIIISIENGYTHIIILKTDDFTNFGRVSKKLFY